MKKFLCLTLLVILLFSCFTLAACTGTPHPDAVVVIDGNEYGIVYATLSNREEHAVLLSYNRTESEFTIPDTIIKI